MMKSKLAQQRLKILFLPRWYPSKIDPMPGLFIERHAEVASRFADVAVLAIIPSKEHAEIEIEKRAHLYTLRYYFKLGETRFLFINKLINQYRWISALLNGYRIVRKEMKGFDLLHVNVLTRLGLFALLIRYIECTPYVITEHWTRYLNGGFKGKLRILFTRLVVNKAKTVSTVTDNLWKSMQSFGIYNPNHLVLQNVVGDLYFTYEKVTNRQGISSPERFIHVSCFTDRSKNISGLLRVLARMNMSGCDFECILVGEGEDLEMLKSYADELGLKSPQVRFKGLLTGEALVQTMHSASFLVLFSNYENMPVVINEAFAVGIPVIATDTGGIREQVKNWNGRLVKPKDEDALFSTILSFIDRPKGFDSEKIKNYAELWFGSSAVENQLKELYADKK
jgi:glycosyltransferase involved in cell wall biosynthesis